MYIPRQFSLSPPSSPSNNISDDEVPPVPIRPKFKKGDKRPRTAAIETPQVSSDGFRHCKYCQGHVRPQMCGSQKHRWRCIDKRCRKWYGWVVSTEEMPANFYIKGRWNSAFGERPPPTPKPPKVQEKKVIKKELVSSPDRMNNEAIFEEVRRATASLQSLERKRIIIPNSQQLFSIYPKREVSPLTLTTQEMNYVPSVMEKRARWWINEKRKRYHSPERVIGADITSVAAAFRLCGLACSTAAATRANEIQSINGALDLLMDTLFGCLGPLLSLATKLPGLTEDSQLADNMWESSCVHIPTFH